MVKRRLTRAALALLLACGLACGEESTPATQLVLVADTDIAAIDSIEFTVEAEGVAPERARAARAAASTPPFVTLLREDGPLTVTVTARGLEGESVVLARSQLVQFVPDQTRVVPLHLSSRCLALRCPESCGEAGCVARELSDEALLPWSGRAPRLGNATGVSCGAETGIDLMTNVAHCGSCGNVCSVSPALRHTVAACSEASCGTRCEPLWDSCDGIAPNGCEQALTDPKHCGSCNRRCATDQRCSELGECVAK